MTSKPLAALAFLFAAALGGACSSGDTTATTAASVSEGCSINSDCTSPLVCAFRRCHNACTTSRDCDPGQRCVASDRPFHVCQLAVETKCSFNSDCAAGQVCGVDGQCRDQCKVDRDCLDGQRCFSASCADVTELVDGGLPAVDAGVEVSGSPCSYNSECDAPLVCRAGQCAFECLADVDCASGYGCDASHRCRAGGGDGGVLPCGQAACTAGGHKCGKVADGCGATIDCGGCGTGEVCSGAAGPNTCITGSCTPLSCSARGKNCGPLGDGCGALLACGACKGTDVCGGGGTPNVCGAQATPPSCQGSGAATAHQCGTGGDDCCASPIVPAGSFSRDNDAAFPATMAAFRLDRFPVDVARFRAFLAAGGGTQAAPPPAAAGAHPGLPSSGWDPQYAAELEADAAALVTSLHGCQSTYTDVAGAAEALPINCVTWYEALAFCAWDNAFLASEAEINDAQVGGDEQRFYPWSVPPDATTVDGSYVNAWSTGNGERPTPVGSKSPKGDGRFGQADLVGNIGQWVVDGWADPIGVSSCQSCVFLSGSAAHVVRGGSYYDYPAQTTNTKRERQEASSRSMQTGLRCARAL